MRLGGFIIHGANTQTLPASVESLRSVCDEVVAVSSVSAEPASSVRTVHHPWQGYGAARAAAVRELAGCDWLLYLDADEWLEQPAREALRAWKAGSSSASVHVVPVRDWAELPSGRFLYRTHHRARLVRREAAVWTPQMIVHEALSQSGSVALRAATVEHRFAVDLPARAAKEEVYALLWAVRAFAEGRRGKLAWLQRPAMFVRDAVLKGALFRGGLSGAKLAWTVAAYHSRKYELLAELRAGARRELVDAYAAGEYGRVFTLAAAT